MAHADLSAAHYLPTRRSLPALAAAARECRGCDLHRQATATVFGAGRAQARLMLVGEMPGDEEDRAGRPFVGPAGRLLDDALERAHIARSDAFVTNVVKHFKWEPRGKRRLHKKPNAHEIRACLPWLEAEIACVQPQVLVCLGATAAKALIGADFRVTRDHGRLVESELARAVTATIHPASVLRQRSSDARRSAMATLVADLEGVARVLGAGR